MNGSLCENTIGHELVIVEADDRYTRSLILS